MTIPQPTEGKANVSHNRNCDNPRHGLGCQCLDTQGKCLPTEAMVKKRLDEQLQELMTRLVAGIQGGESAKGEALDEDSGDKEEPGGEKERAEKAKAPVASGKRRQGSGKG